MKKSALLLSALLTTWSAVALEDAPNILWLTSEDNGPELGCYGDDYAVTPNLDGLARKSFIYLNAWSTAPVCAPARTTIISGMYPPSTGSEHMRSMATLPSDFKMYPKYLREIGYYCTNNSKEDYNLEKGEGVWDDSSRKAHWKNRKPGQPFFSIFNYTISHESKIRNKIEPENKIHDPAKVPVPAYHPDVAESRKDWAQYYDRITMMDAEVGAALKELKDAGLEEDTIIFYYGDHGSGMPRSKRWPYNSGLNVPLLVHVPQKYAYLAPKDYRANSKSTRLVGFVDLAPTLLSIVGIQPPSHMQGSAFMGAFEEKERDYNFGFRGRMDERYDMVRVVRNKRYLYIRNYMPHRIYGQYISYMFQTPTTAKWKEMFDAGQLNAAQSQFWQPKHIEELYDLQEDPDEVNNLVASPEHQDILKELRSAQRELAYDIRDVGFLPEYEIHERSKGSTPFEMGHDPKLFPARKIMQAAEMASSFDEKDTRKLLREFDDKDSAVRYWAATGMLIRGQAGVDAAHDELLDALEDESPIVQVVAAEALGRYGSDEDLQKSLKVLLSHANLQESGIFVAMMANNSLDYLDGKAASIKDQIAALPTKPKQEIKRMGAYVPNLIEKTLKDLE